MNNSVSCIIPVYNGERFLAETVASVLEQTHPIHEILVVDDGSTDGTCALVMRLAEPHAGRIRLLRQAHDRPAAARNTGIQAATGEFITFLDADDLWHTEKTARQLRHFATRPELDISVGHIQNFWMDDLREEAERMRDHPRAKPMAGYTLPSVMIRRTAFDRIGLLDATLRHADSMEWFLRAQAGQLVEELLPDVLVYRRMHGQSYSRNHAGASHAEFLRLLKTRTKPQAAGGN